jgi:TatD DNase family protein
MTTRLVDFHCHLDLYPDHAAVFEDCQQQSIYTLAVTTTPRAWPRNLELASKTKFVRAALGLHPQVVSQRADELDLWEKYLSQAQYVGEVGIDAGPHFFRSLELQKKVFEHILRTCSEHGGKCLSVHSVRATRLVLDMIEQYLPPERGRVVLHWFTGSLSEAKRAVDLGCYFSVNSSMMQTDRSRRVVSRLPLDRILTETDGPFIKMDGRPSRPADVARVVEILAHSRGLEAPTMASTIHTNLRSLLSGGADTERLFG